MKNKYIHDSVLAIEAAFRDWVRHPELLRRLLRDNLPGQIVLCALLGMVVGALTVALHFIVLKIHEDVFNLPPGMHLSSATTIDKGRILVVPGLGGILLGLYILIPRRWKKRELVDPIEANAIYGGRMSVRASLRMVFKTIISNASGVSLGMEAAYTQLGSGLSSLAGQRLKLRRQDLRILVAAGAAAAIAAAFNAPMAGAFYGFELVLGTYTIAALSQVSAAALTATLTMRVLLGDDPIFAIHMQELIIPGRNYFFFVILGVISALVGILTMKSVTYCERIAKASKVKPWLWPAVGGFLISLIALACPQVLGAGQGAINGFLNTQGALIPLLILLAAKIAASAISIGAGFRGGLFSTSLMIGCLLGQVTGIVAGWLLPETAGQITSFTLVGMGSVAASIVGAPVTMVMLVLEMTGSFAATTGVLAGVLVSSAITQHYFGYSFSTWRFHLRGLPIKGGADVGWSRDLTVDKLMKASAPQIDMDMPAVQIRKSYPAGSFSRLFVTDHEGNYKGVIKVPELHDPELDSKVDTLRAIDIAKGEDKYLLPRQDIKTALAVFADAEMEDLPVLEGIYSQKIVGQVTEAFALRRYSQELEIHNRERGEDIASPPVESIKA